MDSTDPLANVLRCMFPAGLTNDQEAAARTLLESMRQIADAAREHERKAPRMWHPGDPEPANAYPYAVHAGVPGEDPWATLCGRRVPRSAIAYHPTMTDCPGCADKIGPLFLVAVREAVRAEREACAAYVDTFAHLLPAAEAIAAAIRARE
jgi:hypothetical protein